MSLPRPIAPLPPLLALGALLAIGGGLAAQPANDRIEVPIDPSQPVTIEIEMPQASVEVIGAAGASQVVVEPSAQDESEVDHDDEAEEEEDEENDERTRGLKRISSGNLGIDIGSSGNQIEIHGGWGSEGLVRVRVPERSNVTLKSLNGDHIVVRGVRGAVEITCQNGDIEATGIHGSLVINATNGDITAELLSVTADNPLSFISFNGDVDVTLPASFAAEVRLSSMQGEIYTDFDLQRLPTEPQVERAEGKVRYRMEREIRGRIGAGGVEARFKTWNGDIYVRRAK